MFNKYDTSYGCYDCPGRVKNKDAFETVVVAIR